MLRKILIAILFIGLIAGGIAYWGYNSVFTPNTGFDEDKQVVAISEDISYEELSVLLKSENVILDQSRFDRVASWMKYDQSKVKSGRYEIKKGWNSREIINLLRSGRQSAVTITFNNVRSLEELSGKISENMAFDSLTFLSYLKDGALKATGLSKEDLMTVFIPNSYQAFWNESPHKVVSRMIKEHSKFWEKNNRKEKAKEQNLTHKEVYTLASIVEKESQHGPERPIIAGLYLNRLRIGMALQADPTVVFAVGDFGLRRVLNKHLEYDSPYNTYKYAGLPPGPIYMPSIESIDAVLNPQKHDYIFMCAKPGYGTQHAFASTSAGHNRNANAYRSWLNKQGIR